MAQVYSFFHINDLTLMFVFLFTPGTGPLERSFSKLAKICYKDRNRLLLKNLELAYLLSCLNITADNALFALSIIENFSLGGA